MTKALAEATVIHRASQVLDVASGTGESARLIANHRGADVTGIEYSEKNTALAKALCKSQSTGIRFVRGAAESLPLTDNCFDVVLCECALCTFEDKTRTLAEMHRVLRPGGRVGISDIVIDRPLPNALGNLTGQILCLNGAMSMERYEGALRQAGFVRVRSRNYPLALPAMLDRIEARLRLAGRLVDLGELTIPTEILDNPDTLAAARDFVRDGGASYAIVTGHKAGTTSGNQRL